MKREQNNFSNNPVVQLNCEFTYRERNQAMNELETLEQALAALEAETGLQALRVESEPEGATCGDGKLDLSMPGAPPVRFAVEIKSVDRFQTLGTVQARARQRSEPPLLVAPYMTAQAAQQCRNLGLNFIDAAGNAYISVQGCFVYITGKPRRRPAHKAIRFKALTPTGLRIVFALLIRPSLLNATYREIAMAAGVALGSVGDVLADLQARGHLAPAGPRRWLEPSALQDEWVTHFPVKLRPRLHARHFTAPAGRDWWKALDAQALHALRAAWGAEVAAYHLTGYLEPERLTLYADAPDALILKHRLRPDPHGEIEILDTFWPLTAGDDESKEGDTATVPPLLVYADLMASADPRNIDTAQRLRVQYLDSGVNAEDIT